MPNHFHLLIQVRGDEILRRLNKTEPDVEFDYHKCIMRQLSNFLNSYAKAFNKRYNRKGSLFIDYTKRKEIKTENYITQVVNYIHRNPVHHKFCKDLKDWQYSSYQSIIQNQGSSRLERNLVFDWFGGLEQFVEFHKQNSATDLEELYR